jgi:hypothetical protein
MSDIDSSKAPPKRQGGRIALLGAAATALAMLNMSVGTEAQSTPVLILEYGALALGLLALIGGLMMTLLQK